MADEEIGPDSDHFVVEVSVKRVVWKPSQVAAAGGRGMTHDGPKTKQIYTLTKLVTTASEVEAAVSKAKRVLDIEVGEDG